MTCEEFRRDYPVFSAAPASTLSSKEYQQWRRHLDGCGACGDFFQAEECRQKGVDVGRFPCVHLAYYTASWVEDAGSLPSKAAIVYRPKFDEFGIHLFDGSVIGIRHCPFCGIALPPSRREQWFGALRALGFDDPVVESIPADFNTDAWYRRPA